MGNAGWKLIFSCQVALGQVMTRLRVGWISLPHRRTHPSDAFRNGILLSMLLVTVNCFLFYLLRDPYAGVFTTLRVILFVTINGAFTLFYIANVVRVRRWMRNRYSIPEKHCRGSEDVVLSAIVPPLVVMQMSRHCADFDTYQAQCWTSVSLGLLVFFCLVANVRCQQSGLPKHVYAPMQQPASTAPNTLSEPLHD